MPKIKGFTTKKDMLQQITGAGIAIRLPFSSRGIKCANPPKCKMVDCEGNEIKLRKL